MLILREQIFLNQSSDLHYNLAYCKVFLFNFGKFLIYRSFPHFDAKMSSGSGPLMKLGTRISKSV